MTGLNVVMSVTVITWTVLPSLEAEGWRVYDHFAHVPRCPCVLPHHLSQVFLCVLTYVRNVHVHQAPARGRAVPGPVARPHWFASPFLLSMLSLLLLTVPTVALCHLDTRVALSLVCLALHPRLQMSLHHLPK